jgi:2-iminoacetate synthase ThiH
MNKPETAAIGIWKSSLEELPNRKKKCDPKTSNKYTRTTKITLTAVCANKCKSGEQH